MDSISQDIAWNTSGKEVEMDLAATVFYWLKHSMLLFIFNKLLAYLVISNAVRNLRYCMTMIKAVFLLSTLALLAAESHMFEMAM